MAFNGTRQLRCQLYYKKKMYVRVSASAIESDDYIVVDTLIINCMSSRFWIPYDVVQLRFARVVLMD